MNRNSKKGFTIVELIIVIAVIAVLAAVLIPTFSNLIQKANEAKDTALVSNLNKAVAMDNGSKETVYDVLKVAEDIAGINVAKINAAANSNEILWDSTNKCFVYSVNGEIKYIPDTKTKDVAGDYDYWKLSSNQEDVKANKYSIYWTGAALSEITATTGFDAGEAEIGKIIYQREDNATAQTVTIRTNGGELEVSAKPDTVYHYDVASKVVVTKIHNASYHENGTVVGNLEVKEGHVELGAKADVSTVIVAPTTANAAKVTVTTGATVGVVAATTDEGKTYLDNATTVPSDKKAETKLDESVLSQFAGGVGTEASPYLIANAEQFSNINKLYAQKSAEGVEYNGKAYCFQQIADIEFETLSIIKVFTGIYDGNGHSISFGDSVKYSSAWLFNTVFDSTTIKNIHYQLKKDQAISLVFKTDWKVDSSDLTFQNIEIDSKGATIVANGSNFGLFSQYANFNITGVKFIDCVNKANLNNSGTSTGVFLGSGWCFDKGAAEKIQFINCKNTGNITGTYYTGVLYGNGSYVGAYEGNSKVETEYSEGNFVVTNVENSGTISANLTSGKASIAPNSKIFDNKVKNTGTMLVGGCFDGKTVKVDLSNSSNMKFSVNGNSDGITYKIAFNINTIWNSDGTQSNTTKYFYDIQKDNSITSNSLTSSYVANSEEKAKANSIDTASLAFDENGIAIVVQESKTVLVFKDGSIGDKKIGEKGVGESSVSIILYAYNSEGLCIGTQNIK